MALTVTEKWSDVLSSPRPLHVVTSDATRESNRTTESAGLTACNKTRRAAFRPRACCLQHGVVRQPLIATDRVVATSSSDGPLMEERSSFLPSGVKRGSLWLAASILLALLASWWSGADPDVASLEHLTPAVQSAPPLTPRETGRRRFVPIETLRVGDRVLADNPEDDKPAAAQLTQVDPATWRKLVLQGRLVWHDGTVDDINVETLQPPEWIAAHDARVGHLVPLPLDLVEMGLPKGLKARVLENLPCPPIRPGPGRVVLTTVNHLNRYVFELRVEDESGRLATLRPTGFHKFFSADRNDWISADSIHEGERLTALGGTVRLVSRVRIPGTHRVYNLTVEGEHVYHVTRLVVDGHNQDCRELVDDLVESSRRPARPGSDNVTRGRQALQKKIDRGSSDFGTEKTQEAAEKIIREIGNDIQSATADAGSVVIRDGAGRGIRISDDGFDTFFVPGGKK